MRQHFTANTPKEQKEIFERAIEYNKDQLSLCDQLDAIADSFPHQVDAQQCLVTSLRIYRVITKAHRFEEENLFPLLIEENESYEMLEEKLIRLKFEHWEDESLAEDISDALWQYASDPKPERCEKLGYMLRGFLGCLRRHIAFEVEYILPQLKSVEI